MTFNMFALAAALASAATLAQAQTYDTTGIRVLDDRIDDIETAAAEDIARSEDEDRFGNPERRLGLSGSAALSYAGQSGNNESQQLAIGARLHYNADRMTHTLGLALDFNETAGASTKEDIFAIYDANYYLTESFYLFMLGRVQTDGLATTAGETATDAFIGIGPGYRVFNTPQLTWRVQAGIGQSYLEDGAGASETELGYIASSRVFYGFSPDIFLTNDTDALKTDSSLRVNNDLGVNFRMTDVLSTRISYLTDYDDSRTIRTDNRLSISLVMGF